MTDIEKQVINDEKLLKLIKNQGPFERNISPLCGHCKYVSDCLYNYGEGDFRIDG